MGFKLLFFSLFLFHFNNFRCSLWNVDAPTRDLEIQKIKCMWTVFWKHWLCCCGVYVPKWIIKSKWISNCIDFGCSCKLKWRNDIEIVNSKYSWHTILVFIFLPSITLIWYCSQNLNMSLCVILAKILLLNNFFFVYWSFCYTLACQLSCWCLFFFSVCPQFFFFSFLSESFSLNRTTTKKKRFQWPQFITVQIMILLCILLYLRFLFLNIYVVGCVNLNKKKKNLHSLNMISSSVLSFFF